MDFFGSIINPVGGGGLEYKKRFDEHPHLFEIRVSPPGHKQRIQKGTAKLKHKDYSTMVLKHRKMVQFCNTKLFPPKMSK